MMTDTTTIAGREGAERGDSKEQGKPDRSEDDNHGPQRPHVLREYSTTLQGLSLDLMHCIIRHLLFIHSANID